MFRRIMRPLRHVLSAAPLLAVLVSHLLPQSAETLPLFSRGSDMPCTRCHSAFPRLNAFGMRFRQNGYRVKGQTGRLQPLSGGFPLSLVGNVGVAFTRADTAERVTGAHRIRNEREFVQNALELHSAGTLVAKVSYHFSAGFDGPRGPLKTGTAFVQFDDLVEDGGLNLKVGFFDAEVPFLAGSRTTTLHEYHAPVTLDARGLEFNGIRSAWTYAAGLINSERDPANARPGATTFNRLQDTYVWLMRDVGGQQFAARMFFGRQDSNLPGLSWLQHLQGEISACLGSDRFVVVPGYLLNRFDDRPGPGIHDTHDIGLLEAHALLDEAHRWALTTRIEFDHRRKTVLTAEEDRRLGALNLSYYVIPNARAALEWAHTADNASGERLDEWNAFVQVGY